MRRASEGKSYGKVEGEVAAQAGMGEGIVFAGTLIRWVDAFHSHIKAENEIVEVEAKTHSIAHSYLLEEGVISKLSAWLVLVVAQGPHVAGIYKECTVDLPKEVCTIFEIDIQLHITSLVDKVDIAIFASKLSRTEISHTPSPHTIRTSREIAFFEGKNTAVAIRIGESETEMKD